MGVSAQAGVQVDLDDVMRLGRGAGGGTVRRSS